MVLKVKSHMVEKRNYFRMNSFVSKGNRCFLTENSMEMTNVSPGPSGIKNIKNSKIRTVIN